MTQIAIFLITTLHELISDKPGCTLYYFGAVNAPSITVYKQFWRLLTAVFLHANILHICMNAAATFSFGFRLENVYGTKNLMIIYFVSGIGGSLFVAAFKGAGVGASGALFGLMHMAFYCDLRNTFSANALRSYRNRLIFLFLFSLLPGISFLGHLGGYLTGVLITTIILDSSIIVRKTFWKQVCTIILLAFFVIAPIVILNFKGMEWQARSVQEYCGSIFWWCWNGKNRRKVKRLIRLIPWK